ncbi:MAG: hypothetical protein ACYC18_11990, partial [Gammaproteobacteria bacterium]
MSYILEALKKSERARGQGAVSPLTIDLRTAAPATLRRPWGPWAAGAAAGIVVAVASAWWILHERSPVPAPALAPGPAVSGSIARAPAPLTPPSVSKPQVTKPSGTRPVPASPAPSPTVS